MQEYVDRASTTPTWTAARRLHWDVGDGEDAYALYPTDALPLLDDPGLNRWREQGVDFVGTLVSETRRRGLEAFWNSRVAPVDPAQPSLGQPLTDPARRNWLKEEHPDWVQRCWWWNGLYDLSSPGLREHKVAVLRDLLAHYAFDGLQLDFSRHQPTLPIGRQWQHREDATAYVRGVREMTLEMEARSGRPILLAVKVPETVAGCAIDGLDVATWARELLVDIFVIGARTLTVDVAGLQHRRRHPDPHRCHPRRPPLHRRVLQPVPGGLPGRLLQFLGAGRGLRDRLQLAHGARGALHSAGLTGRRDGRHLRPAHRGDVPDRRAGRHGRPRRHLRRRAPRRLSLDRRGLLLLLQPRPAAARGAAEPRAAVHLPLQIWRDGSRSRLRVILWAADAGDGIEVWLGGTRLRELARDATVKDPQIYGGGPQPSAGSIPSYVEDPDQRLLQVTFELPARDLIAGENRISIAAGERAPYRPAMYGNGIVVEKVEADIRYHRDTPA